jgi:uncharacterized protein YdeI (YjbR/CyaY-like superfamily)
MTCYQDTMPKDELPLLIFFTTTAFKQWLAAQPDNSPGAWLKFAKKGASQKTITKSDAVDFALAHGWVDGQLGRVDEFFFKTRFTPRRPKSAWSKINRERAERLIKSGQMTMRGQSEIDRAKTDGRWQAAYTSQSKAVPHADLQAALDRDAFAREAFEALDSANRYAILYRVQRAKTGEKRTAKIAELLAMLRRGETLHPRRARATRAHKR